MVSADDVPITEAVGNADSAVLLHYLRLVRREFGRRKGMFVLVGYGRTDPSATSPAAKNSAGDQTDPVP